MTNSTGRWQNSGSTLHFFGGAAGLKGGASRKPPHLAHHADQPSPHGGGVNQQVTYGLGHISDSRRAV